ncbi:hypothetical protein [Streptomyces orinoci]|uniref:Uncharacterized protein n=1 Tax=Streptomyces orinoci TaxID=67339 RepID=A0ABV3JUE7_STRON|nr:hypothetical protein [Streptomyces orinoci]
MRIARIAVAAAVTMGVATMAVAPASAAVATAHSPRTAAVAANPKTIKAAEYNQARSILANAGSQTAAKSHPVHGKNDVPVGYGTSLLAAARDEFRAQDKNLPAKDKKSDMSIAHYNAIHSAASTMHIDRW